MEQTSRRPSTSSVHFKKPDVQPLVPGEWKNGQHVPDGVEENFVKHVLLAEFDIDQGATLSLQYPFPTGTDEQ